VGVVEGFELTQCAQEGRWFQIKVRSRSSRRQVWIQRSAIALEHVVNNTLSG
jgi:hypothetical protein